MGKCINYVNTANIVCNNFAEKMDYTCTTWADEGSSKCTKWADEGSKKCCDWRPCRWFCRVWYWVAKWVCKISLWIAKWVCKAFAFFIVLVCTSYSFIATRFCNLWIDIVCILNSIASSVSVLFKKTNKAKPKIEHVFVLMLENRSYDHIFGFSNIKGHDSITGEEKVANGINYTFSNAYRKEGENIDTIVNASTPADYFLNGIDIDPGHNFNRTLSQLCGNVEYDANQPLFTYPPINNSGFVETYKNMNANNPERIMKCFSKEQLPILNRLADEFAVCDNWFSSLPGPTTTNRLFLLAGTSGGLIDNPNPNPLNGGNNLSIEDLLSAFPTGFKFQNGHIFNELDSNCIDWLVFAGDAWPNSIMLDGMIGENIDPIRGRLKLMDGLLDDSKNFENKINDSNLSEKFIFIEPKYDGGNVLNPGTNHYICGNSMHPVDDVSSGEKLIKRVYEGIRNSPHWEKSVLIITFDEHGGFYDHVAPPGAENPRVIPPNDIALFTKDPRKFKFNQFGARVPAIVISPWIKKGTIDSVLYDHTSVLATLRKLFGLNHLTNRDKNANDLLHLLSLTEPRKDTPQRLPEISRDSNFTCERNPTVDKLLSLQANLMAAKQLGYYNKKKLADYELSDSDIGFAHIGLIRVTQKMHYKEKLVWINEFKNIKTGLDATKFRNEVDLKLLHGINIHAMTSILNTDKI